MSTKINPWVLRSNLLRFFFSCRYRAEKRRKKFKKATSIIFIRFKNAKFKWFKKIKKKTRSIWVLRINRKFKNKKVRFIRGLKYGVFRYLVTPSYFLLHSDYLIQNKQVYLLNDVIKSFLHDKLLNEDHFLWEQILENVINTFKCKFPQDKLCGRNSFVIKGGD